MRRTLMALIVLGLLLPTVAMAVDVLDVDASKYLNQPDFIGYVPDRFIVILKEGSTVDHRRDARVTTALSNFTGFEELAQKYEVSRLQPQFPGSDVSAAATAIDKGELARHYKVNITTGTLEDAMADYAALPDVERVEPIGIHTLRATPNDGYYDNPPPEFPYDQWHYWDTYGIEADQAWNDETGSQAVIVGDLDIGTKYDHGDLGGSNPPGPNDNSTNGNIWVNSNEIPGNGIDDDGNGYVDDVIGWDFVDRTNWYVYSCVDADCGGADNDPFDGDGHGTHTAGTIAAITNNGYAVAGVAGGFGDGTFAGGGNGVKIVPCRIGYDLSYQGQTLGVVIMDYVAEAMYYMADLKQSGWNVAAINCSFGTSNSGGLGAACDYLVAQDVLVVVAAGNSNSSSPDYLGSRTDCLDVGATDQSGNPASFSNYGSWVDIAAPGVSILSTITDPSDPSGDYVAALDGTSMACPHVVGVAALLESYDPSLSAQDKWDLMVNNTKPYNMTKNVGVGIVDVRACLDAIGPSCDVAADFSANTTSGCAPLTVNFSDQSTGTGVDGWSWTFGDGGTSTAQNPSYTYTAAGTYTVTLTASSSSQSCNDVATKTGYITVTTGPTASFTGSPTSGEVPLTVTFSNASSGATSYSWTFGDGGTSTAANPSYTYTSAGTFTVALTATNACGSDVQTRTNYISVTCTAPTASFTGSPTSGNAPLTVNFTDASTGATSWSWDFGDGVGTSTAQNPSYSYTSAGTYTVTLTATNACGSDVNQKVDYITVSPCVAPVADFSGSPTSGVAPLTVNFSDLSTGNPTSWSWTFGDGGSSTQQDPSYTYTAAGTYSVSMTATNGCGSDNATKTDYITVTEPSSARAYAQSDISVLGSFSGAYTDTYLSDNVYETVSEALSTNHPVKVTSNAEHKWTFTVPGGGSNYVFKVEAYRDNNSEGDDFTFAYSTDDATYINMATVASSAEQVYSYSLPNLSGTVYVRVIDGNRSWGNTSLESVYVDEMYVEYETTPGPPVATFAGSPTSGSAPLTVNFTDLSTGDPTSWDWSFGDGGTSTSQNPSHSYTANGTYTVSLTVSNAYGSDTDTKVGFITVADQSNIMHVANMVVGRTKSGPNYLGTCTVTIADANSQPVSGAIVYVTATGPTGGSFNGITAADGTVDFQTSGIKKPSGEWCFEVTDVTHSSYTYDSGANNVTAACESGWLFSQSGGDITALNEPLPTAFELGQNHPNPFNPTTVISFTMPEAAHATVTVYNVAGQKVATLADREYGVGRHEVEWDAASLASGVYFYRLQAGDYVETRKMILLK